VVDVSVLRPIFRKAVLGKSLQFQNMFHDFPLVSEEQFRRALEELSPAVLWELIINEPATYMDCLKIMLEIGTDSFLRFKEAVGVDIFHRSMMIEPENQETRISSLYEALLIIRKLGIKKIISLVDFFKGILGEEGFRVVVETELRGFVQSLEAIHSFYNGVPVNYILERLNFLFGIIERILGPEYVPGILMNNPAAAVDYLLELQSQIPGFLTKGNIGLLKKPVKKNKEFE